MASDEQSADFSSFQLSEQDAIVFDAIMQAHVAGADAGPLPPGSSERAAQARKLLDLLKRMPVDDAPADLVDRTMSSITAAQQRARFSQQIGMLTGESESEGFGVNLRQAMSAAAVVVLGLTLLLPTLSRSRHEAQRLACASHMNLVGQGLGEYAQDHAGLLPRVSWDPFSNSSQLQPGLKPHVALHRPTSNSANLFLLIRHGYVNARQVACPAVDELPQANAEYTDFKSAEHVPFSYQNQVTTPKMQLSQLDPNRAVLADRNPLFVIRNGRFVFDESRSPQSVSQSHAIPGQNVVRADLSVRWTVRPVVQHRDHSEDNIWVIEKMREVKPASQPKSTVASQMRRCGAADAPKADTASATAEQTDAQPKSLTEDAFLTP